MLNLRDALDTAPNPSLNYAKPSLAAAYTGLDPAAAGDFRRGWVSSGMQADAAGIWADANEAYRKGDPLLGKALERTAADQAARAQQWAPTVQNFTDVNSLRSGVDWLAGAAGNLHSSVPAAVGGLAGAAVGGLGGAMVGGVPGAVAGAGWGSSIGSGLMGYKGEYDEAVAQAMQDQQIRDAQTMQDIHNAAQVKGVVGGALESIVPGGMAKSIALAGTKKLGKDTALKTLGKGIAVGGAEEFGTEYAQELTGQATQNYLRGDALTNFDHTQALNAGMSGLVGGGIMGGAGGAANAVRTTNTEKPADNRSLLDKGLDAVVAGAGKAGELAGKAVNKFEDRIQQRDHDQELRGFTSYPKNMEPEAASEHIRQKAPEIAEKILTNPREYRNEGVLQAAADFMVHKDDMRFRNELNEALGKQSRMEVADSFDIPGTKSSKMTPEGEELSSLANAWVSREGKRYSHLFDESDDGKALGAKLFGWIKSDFGRTLTEDGEVHLPRAMLDELGDNASTVVSSAVTAARKQGWDIKDAGDIEEMVRQYSQDQSGDVALLRNKLRYDQEDRWDNKKLIGLSQQLRESKGRVSKRFLEALGEGFSKPEEFLTHFQKDSPFYKNKKLGFKQQAVGVESEGFEGGFSDDETFGNDSDHGSDVNITDNDSDWNSGVQVSEGKSYRMKLLSEHDLADPDQTTALMEGKRGENIQELGVVDAARRRVEPQYYKREEEKLLKKYGYSGGMSAKDFLDGVNKQHRVLVRHDPVIPEGVIAKENYSEFKAPTVRHSYDSKGNKESTRIDDIRHGVLHLKLNDGTIFPVNAATLIQSSRTTNNLENNIVGETAELTGTKAIENSFYDGFAQLQSALYEAGKLDKGAGVEVGFKRQTGSQMEWTKDLSLPKEFAFFPPKTNAAGEQVDSQYTMGRARPTRRAGKIKEVKPGYSKLSISDMPNMTRSEVMGLIADIIPAIQSAREKVDSIREERLKVVRNLETAIEAAKNDGKKDRVKRLVANLKVEKEKADLALANDNRYAFAKSKVDSLRETFDKIVKEYESRTGERAPGEKKLQAPRSSTESSANTNMHDGGHANPNVTVGSVKAGSDTGYTDARGRSRKAEQATRALGEGRPLPGKATHEGVMQETEEMAANNAREQDDKVRVLDERGEPIASAPTDSAGFYRESVAHRIHGFYNSKSRKPSKAGKMTGREAYAAAEVMREKGNQEGAWEILAHMPVYEREFWKQVFKLERAGKFREAAKLVAVGPKPDIPEYKSKANPRIEADKALSIVRGKNFEGTAIQYNLLKKAVGGIKDTLIPWLNFNAPTITVTTSTKVSNGSFSPLTNQLRISNALLISGDTTMQHRVLAHETAHSADFIEIVETENPDGTVTRESIMRSSSAPELKFSVEGDVRVPKGIVISEVFEYIKSYPNTKLTKLLNRAHSKIGNSLTTGNTRNHMVAAELHARLAEVYILYPDHMKRLLPQSFAYMEKENERIRASGNNDTGDQKANSGAGEGTGQSAGTSKPAGGSGNGRLDERATEGVSEPAEAGGEGRRGSSKGAGQRTLDVLKKSEQSADGTKIDPEQAIETIKQAFGEHFPASVEPTLGGDAGQWTEHGIKLAMTAPNGTEYHEMLHEFFSQLSKHGAANVKDLIKRVATNPLILKQLKHHLANHPEALAQLNSPEEAAAFMYQFHQLGLMKLGPEAEGLFAVIKDFIGRMAKKLYSLFDPEYREKHLTEEKARKDLDKAFEALATIRSGELATTDAAAKQQIYDALRANVEQHDKVMEQMGKQADTIVDNLGKLFFSAEARMDRTKDRDLINIMRLFHQKAGTDMLSGKSTGGADWNGGFMEASGRETNAWMSKLDGVMAKFDKEDIELARPYLESGKLSGNDDIDAVVKAIWAFNKEIFEYLDKQDVRRLDREGPGKPKWVKMEARRNYFSQVWGIDELMDKRDEFLKTILDKHRDKLEHIAAEANLEVFNHTVDGSKIKPGTAADMIVKEHDQRFKEALEAVRRGEPMVNPGYGTATAETVAEAIYSRLLNSQGMIDIDENESSMGITPGASAINRRQLDWLDKEAFSQFKSKDVAGIMGTYVRNMIKRAEYQKRFGYGGEKITEAVDKAFLRNVNGNELVEAAESALPGAIEAWNTEAAIWHEDNPKQPYPVPFPTLRLVGMEIDRERRGVDVSNESVIKASKQMEPITNAIAGLEGTLGNDINPTLRKAMSWINTYTAIRVLPLMLFTNFNDVIGLTMNGGTLGDAWNAFVQGVKGIKDSVTDTPTSDKVMLRGEQWGAADAAGFTASLSQNYGSIYMSAGAKKVSEKFFKYTGMQGWNRGIRAFGATVAERTIMNWVQNGLDQNNKAEVSRFERLYGKGAKVDSIKLDPDGNLDIADARNRAAVNRWVLDAVVTSNAAHRTVWMSDPNYMNFAFLKNFAYSFHRVILKGIWEQAKLGNYRPALVAALGYAPISIAAGALKEMLIPGEEPPWMKGGLDGYLSYGYSQANLGGVPQMIVGDLKDPARLMGPFFDQIQNGLSIPIGEVRMNLSPFEGDSQIIADHKLDEELMGALPAGNILKRLVKD